MLGPRRLGIICLSSGGKRIEHTEEVAMVVLNWQGELLGREGERRKKK